MNYFDLLNVYFRFDPTRFGIFSNRKAGDAKSGCFLLETAAVDEDEHPS